MLQRLGAFVASGHASNGTMPVIGEWGLAGAARLAGIQRCRHGECCALSWLRGEAYHDGQTHDLIQSRYCIGREVQHSRCKCSTPAPCQATPFCQFRPCCCCPGPPFNCGGGPADEPTAQQVSVLLHRQTKDPPLFSSYLIVYLRDPAHDPDAKSQRSPALEQHHVWSSVTRNLQLDLW